jgi:hypothetical protein
MEVFLKPINKFIELSGFVQLGENDKLRAIALAVGDGELHGSHVQWLCSRMVATYHAGMTDDAIDFYTLVYYDECFRIVDELRQRKAAQQSVYSKSFFNLVLLFSAVSCLITADVYSRRLSNINACDTVNRHTAVSKQSLTGDYHFLVSGYNHNTIAAIHKETTHTVVQYENVHDSNLAITHAVVSPDLNLVDSRVTIFDPGGPQFSSDVTLLELPT